MTYPRPRAWACFALGILQVCACTDSSRSREGAARARRVDVSPGQAAADSTLRQARVLYDAERYDSARTVWTLALRQARAAHDPAIEVRALVALAQVAIDLSDYREARGLGEEAVTTIERSGLAGERSAALRVLGRVAMDEGRNRDAAELFARALEAARQSGNRSDEARAAGNLGLVQAYLGDYERALEAHRAARAAGRALGDSRLEARGLHNEAMVEIWRGEARPGIAHLDTARSLYRTTRFLTGEQQALAQLATAYELLGDEARALALLDSSLALARQLGNANEEADVARLIAGVHLRLGDVRRARETYRVTEASMRERGLTGNLGSVLRGSAEAGLRLGDLPQARRDLEQALVLHLQAGEPDARLSDLVLAVELSDRSGDVARADRELASARTLAESLGTRRARDAVALAAARHADQRGDARGVLRALAPLAAEVAAGDVGVEWRSRALAARAHARLGKIDAAVTEGRAAVAAVERLRGALASEALHASYVVDRSEVYADLVVNLLRLGRVEEGFAVSDAARSRITVASMPAFPRNSAGSGAGDLAEGEQLLRRIDELVQRLRNTEAAAPPERGVTFADPSAGTLDELAAARARYDALAQRTAARRNRTDLMLGLAPVIVREVQAALLPAEILVEYLLAPRELVTFVVSRERMEVLRAPVDAAALVQRTWLLRDIWGSSGATWHDGLPAARALYETLLGPVERSPLVAAAQRLVIVPHGILGQVPFAALVRSGDDRFVMQRFALLQLPSATTFTAARGAAGGDGRQAAGTAFAPFPRELPSTAEEVAAFRAAAPSRRAVVGAAATEGAVRSALGGDGIVHVATHGILNVRSPMFSRLELARAAPSSAADDGRLEVHEMIGLRVRSPLVFLSGCETGAGVEWSEDPVRGTGDLSLARALLAAGAMNVVTTLWRIDDAGAAAFARAFYRALPTRTLAGALADAQRALATDARFSSPHYWAAYTLSGSGAMPRPAQDR